MDTIITFLEQYWGYTIFGGVSLGTIITTIIVLIKTVLKDKHKDTLIDDALAHANRLCDELNSRNENYEKEKEELHNFIATQQTELSNIVVKVQESANKKINALEDALTKKQNELIIQQNNMVEKEKYFEQVQATTFQAISYLVLASKLPTEDKLVLQDKFNSLAKTHAGEYKQLLTNTLAETFTDTTNIEVSNIPVNNTIVSSEPDILVQESIKETQSLLDKYMKEG
jgi:hypothetical protein